MFKVSTYSPVFTLCKNLYTYQLYTSFLYFLMELLFFSSCRPFYNGRMPKCYWPCWRNQKFSKLIKHTNSYNLVRHYFSFFFSSNINCYIQNEILFLFHEKALYILLIFSTTSRKCLKKLKFVFKLQVYIMMSCFFSCSHLQINYLI